MREEEERLQREESIRKKIEEQQRLEKEKKRFAMRMDFGLSISRPPKGTVMPGPLQKEAAFRVSCNSGTLVGGASLPTHFDFATADDCFEALPSIVGNQARAACDAYSSSLRLQSMTGEGPLKWLDDVELRYWMYISAMRTAISVLSRSQQALQHLPFECNIQTRTEYGVLPEDHPKKLSAQLDRAISLIETGRSVDAQDLLMGDLALECKVAIYTDLPPLPSSLDCCPPFLGFALLCAHLLDRCLHDRPARVSDAPAWFEAAVMMVRSCLQESTSNAGPDTLQASASLLDGVLGKTHPVASIVSHFSEANLSSTKKQARVEKERLAKAELAAKLLEEEWPDANELKKARMADKEAKTPIPERVWALRNVAGTLAMGGPTEKGQARRLLEQAVLLKQQFANAPDHPGVLPELCALFDLLQTQKAWENDAKGVASLILKILGTIAESYIEIGDVASAVVLLEAGLRLYDDCLGVRNPLVLTTLRKLEGCKSSLEVGERDIVAKLRGNSKQVLDRLSDAMTEPLQAFQSSSLGGPSCVEQWNSRGAYFIGSLL